MRALLLLQQMAPLADLGVGWKQRVGWTCPRHRKQIDNYSIRAFEQERSTLLSKVWITAFKKREEEKGTESLLL